MRSLNPFAVHEGALIGQYTARFAEATAVRRAEREARAARAEAELTIRARSEFLSNMNHELRTPLNAIIGFATMLRDADVYGLGDEQRRAYAEYVLQSADLLLGHINTILEAAALDGGQVALEQVETDLAALLGAAIGRATIAADAAGVKIENRTAQDEKSLCLCDSVRAGQALDHLLRVAIAASPKGARVYVRAARGPDGRPEIAIRDRGEGLSPETVRQALSAFEEVHCGLDRSFAGPGVGLAIAKTFIEIQGGALSIESRKGKGAVMRVSMPPAHAAHSEKETAVRLAG